MCLGTCKIRSSELFVGKVLPNLPSEVVFWAGFWGISKIRSSEIFVDEVQANLKVENIFGACV